MFTDLQSLITKPGGRQSETIHRFRSNIFCFSVGVTFTSLHIHIYRLVNVTVTLVWSPGLWAQSFKLQSKSVSSCLCLWIHGVMLCESNWHRAKSTTLKRGSKGLVFPCNFISHQPLPLLCLPWFRKEIRSFLTAWGSLHLHCQGDMQSSETAIYYNQTYLF